MNRFFSKITFDPEAEPRDLSRFFGQGGYQLHQKIWKWFSVHEDQNRDFLYRFQFDDRMPSHSFFYTVSARPPKIKGDILSCDSKEYEPELKPGDRLSFDLRANPVVRRDKKNHDVVIDWIKSNESERDKEIPKVLAAREAGYRWLAKRQDQLGCEFDEELFEVSGYEQVVFYPSKGKSQTGRKPIRFSTLDIRGVLTVTDAKSFRQTLFEGVGRAKGFGCGLMLARRC